MSRRRRHRSVARWGFVASLLLVAATALPAHAGSAGPCAARFPESSFDTAYAAGPVMVYGSGLGDPMTARFAGEIEPLAVILQSEMGGLDGAAVCIFSDELPLDSDALGWHPGHQLRAVAFGDEALVVLSAWQPGVVADGGYRGLVHVAQWRVSGGGYSAMLADDVLGWYRNRLHGTVGQVHKALVRQNIGLREPWSPFPWLLGEAIGDPLLWNPQSRYGGAGDFTDFAVGRVGTGWLSDPRRADIAVLDGEWRAALFDESGSIRGGSRTWVGGALIVGGVLVVAILMAFQGRRERLRIDRELREAAFDDQRARHDASSEQSVRPLVAGGLSRPHTRVGRGSPGPVGVHGDDRHRAPSGRGVGTALDDVPAVDEAGDDLFRHPDFDGDR